MKFNYDKGIFPTLHISAVSILGKVFNTFEHFSVTKSLAIAHNGTISGLLLSKALAAFLTIKRDATKSVAISDTLNCKN